MQSMCFCEMRTKFNEKICLTVPGAGIDLIHFCGIIK